MRTHLKPVVLIYSFITLFTCQCKGGMLVRRNLRLLSITFIIVALSISGFYSLAESKQNEDQSKALVKLRSSYEDLTVSQVHKLPGISIRKKKKWGFFGHCIIKHDYEAKIIKSDMVVIDHTTGLMWHRSGSEEYMTWRSAKKWVAKLNTRKYAGYMDWRLPTLEEAASLLEFSKINGRFIALVFDRHQQFIWTGDTKNKGFEAWLVSYYGGSVYWLGIIHNRFVRPVRSAK